MHKREFSERCPHDVPYVFNCEDCADIRRASVMADLHDQWWDETDYWPSDEDQWMGPKYPDW
jgi:hypothetical protein